MGNTMFAKSRKTQVKDAQWEFLPAHTLEKIFSFLGHNDRARASGVCKSWAEAHSSPGLWRDPVFSFCNVNSYHKSKSSPRQIVHKYGKFFRKLTVVFNRYPVNSMKFVSHQISEFLTALKEEGVQLESLRMHRMSILSEGRRLHLSFDQITEFLKMQTNLKYVDFNNARVVRENGLQVLESLQSPKVAHLSMQNFFVDQFSSITSVQRYLDAISKFSNVKTFCISYNYLSDRVLEVLCSGLKDQLEILSILCRVTGMLDSLVSDACWKLLKKSSPKVKVEFTLDISERVTIKEVLERNILSRYIPLKLIFVSCSQLWFNSDDHIVFNYLTDNFAETLREAVFDLSGYNEAGIAEGLRKLVHRCPNLNRLILRARFPDFGMKELFDKILDEVVAASQERPVSLTEFRATFRGLQSYQKRYVPIYKITYKELFRNLGVKFKLKDRK